MLCEHAKQRDNLHCETTLCQRSRHQILHCLFTEEWKIWIDSLDLLTQGLTETAGISLSAHVYRHRETGRLDYRQVKMRGIGFIEAVGLDVSHDANNRHPWGFVVT